MVGLNEERIKELAERVGLKIVKNEDGTVSYQSVGGGLESSLFRKMEEFNHLIDVEIGRK